MSRFTIHRDLLQAVARPDPDGSVVIQLAKPASAQFVLAEKQPDDQLGGRVVVYHREATAAGNFRLMRKVDTSDQSLPGIYAKIGFGTIPMAGGPFLRVTLHVIARDAAAPAGAERDGAEEAVLSTVVRVAPVEMLGNPIFDRSYLDGIKAVPPLKGSLGF